MKKFITAVAIVVSACMVSACMDGEEFMDPNDLSVTKDALYATCTIVVGGGGNSQTITHTFTSSGSYSVNTSSAWDFIRSTSGNCKFTVYNDTNLSGRYVTLGTGLSTRIRAGENGIRYKDDGGDGTWKIRSIKIEPYTSTSCYLNIGGNGVRMNYYPGEYNQVPAMDRMTYFLGGNCDGKIWNEFSFGQNDYYNRFKSIHTNTTSASTGSNLPVYDPGYRVRSMKINDLGSTNCTTLSTYNMDYGRCLPYVYLSESIFTSNSNNDLDQDGLHDYYEDILADKFRPIVLNHSTEDATREAAYTDYLGNTVIEPVTVFQVRKVYGYPEFLDIIYMQLWERDVQNTTFCYGHQGDSEWSRIVLRTIPNSSNSLYGKYWYVYSTNKENKLFNPYYSNTSNTSSTTTENSEIDEQLLYDTVEEQEENERIMLSDYIDNADGSDLMETPYDILPAYEKDFDKESHRDPSENGCNNTRVNAGSTDYPEFKWRQGDTLLRAPAFETASGDSSTTANHVIYYYSKGKHHEYQDGGWSGAADKKCANITAYTNGRGELHNPPYPKRALNIRSKSNNGDQYHYTNVGSRNHYTGFTNSLENLGFPGYKVWEDRCFKSPDTKSVNRSFFCSNNANRACCLENDPGCVVQNSWNCE